tara:strand:+ start:115 stop:1170 length:1056 start_codon:yes stop_codon:yes gene_type:complete
MSLPVSGNLSDHLDKSLTHCPRANSIVKNEVSDIFECEKLLKEWFNRDVILLSSGRAGIHLFLQTIGFQRYKNKLEIPFYLSRCVINAITPTAFPVNYPENSDGILYYHQHGFPQKWEPKSINIIEDIAHSFFYTEETGSRNWIGDVAVFSLPKFFSMNGLVGGLVLPNKEISSRIKELINSHYKTNQQETREWMRSMLNDSYKSNDEIKNIYLDSAYELLLKLVLPDPIDLVGFPKTIEEIKRIGKARKKRIEFFFNFFKDDIYPESFWNKEDVFLPFAIPYFGKGDLNVLKQIDVALNELNIKSGIYNIDINRNSRNSNYRPCVLIPSHHDIPMETFEKTCQIITNNDK